VRRTKSTYFAAFLGVMVAALFSSPTPARADSIPTLAATSVSYNGGRDSSWGISGDSFSVGGEGGHNPNLGDFTNGSHVHLTFLFAADLHPIGSGGTFGQVTLNGVSHDVVLLATGEITADGTLNPTIIGPNSYPPNTDGITATLPATADFFESPAYLVEMVPCGPPAPNGSYCQGNALAQVTMDISGTMTIGGFTPSYSGNVNTSALSGGVFAVASAPEPVSAGLEAGGMAALIGLCILGRKRRFLKHLVLRKPSAA